MKTPSFLKKTDIGLLLLRLGLGVMLVVAHGLPKLLAGAIELLGGILLVLGVFVRPAAMALLAVMIVAATAILTRGESLNGVNAQPVEVGAACLALVFLGAGKYSLDRNG